MQTPVDSETQAPVSKARLSGIDLCRALAAFGVIAIHVGLATGGRFTRSAALLQASFGFAVPFFLAASFYFAASSCIRAAQSQAEVGIEDARNRFAPWVKQRASRLLLPYLLWTLIYFLLRSLKYVVQHQPERLAHSLDDLTGTFLLGGTAVHLYFLPLLFIGLVTLRLVAPIGVKARSWVLLLLLLASLALDYSLTLSGNSFNIATDTAFDPVAATLGNFRQFFLLRLGLVALAHMIRCLPLILGSFLLARHLDWLVLRLKPAGLGLLGVIGLVVALGFGGAWGGFAEPVLGFSALFMALSLSSVLPQSSRFAQAGAFSFGIYLMHQVPLEVLQFAWKRLSFGQRPVGIMLLIALSAGVFGACWLVLALVNRGGPTMRKFFAINA